MADWDKQICQEDQSLKFKAMAWHPHSVPLVALHSLHSSNRVTTLLQLKTIIIYWVISGASVLPHIYIAVFVNQPTVFPEPATPGFISIHLRGIQTKYGYWI